MNKFVISLIFFALSLSGQVVKAQISNDSRTLFTINEKDVTVSEFEYVYTKNNIRGDADYSKASLDEYLKLFINFRLKVLEAEERGLDTVKAINDELDGYRKQLSKSYLTDKTIFDQLVKEAYDRMQKEIHVKHIMVQVEENAFPQDTLAALKRIQEIRSRLVKGESFETLAKLFSDDKSVTSNGGDLGYLTVFQTVYPFENAMYNTEIGQISKPIRTPYGYHIITVEDVRKSRGSVQIAQILEKVPQDATDTELANLDQKIHSIYKDIASGESTFEEMVVEHSDDSQTKNLGGLVINPYTASNWFETGQLFDEVEEVAFSLDVGEVSKPVKTNIGWIIIKVVDKRGIQPFETVKNQLKAKVERDSRSRVAQNVMLHNIKKENNFTEYNDNKREMFEKIPEDMMNQEWENLNSGQFEDPLFTLAGNTYLQMDFVSFLQQNLKKNRLNDKEELLDLYYDRFVEKVCFEYEETQLEKKDPYFKALMKEYRDGILLFELTDEMVWSKAIEDTTGLKAFHEANKNKYMWDERVDVVKYECKNEDVADMVRKYALKKSPSEVVEKVNKKYEEGVIMRTGKFEKGQDEQVDQTGWEKGLSKNFENSNGTITVIHVKDVLPATPKQLNEAKGYVVSDYQEYLEKEWIEELKDKYPVTINESVLNSLIQ